MIQVLGFAAGAIARTAITGLVAGVRAVAAGTRLAATTIAEAAIGTARIAAGTATKIATNTVVSGIKSRVEDEVNEEGVYNREELDILKSDKELAKQDADRVKDNQQDAEPINDQQNAKKINDTTNIQILNSISNQVVILRNIIKSYENFLYQKEQTDEAIQAEKFVEEDGDQIGGKDIKSKKENNKKDEGILGKIIGFIAFGLFAFLPALLSKAKEGIEFIKSFASNIKETFFEIIDSIKQTINEYVIDPIKTFFTETIPIAWHNIMFTVQDIIEAIIDAPKNAINSLMQLGDQIVIEAIDKIINFIKEHQTIINIATFGKGKAIVDTLENQSKKRKEHKEGLQQERDTREEERKRAAEERESQDVAAEMKKQQDLRGRPPPAAVSAPSPTVTTEPAKTLSEGEAKSEPPSTSEGGGSLTSVFSLADPGVDISKIDPEFVKKAIAMGKDFTDKTGKKMMITSGYRSNEKQKKLWDAELAKNNGNAALTRKKVAEPMPPLGNGKGSAHARGMALDINAKGPASINVLAGPRSKSTGWLESFGLARNVPGEDWHVIPNGVPPAPDNPVQPGKPVELANKNPGEAMNVAAGKKESKPIETDTANSGNNIGESSMAAKIDPPPKTAPVIIVKTPAPAKAASNNTKKPVSVPKTQQAQNLYQTHLATART